ncbi:MAG: hypothetical protein PWQ82_298 [Thermosediminibacterales bacterium]|nr:hypothetical protein [Thermosediminibacterales bacterium]MDK2835823.1 hypothetical protein [Thermosediminibacterales bacterium]
MIKIISRKQLFTYLLLTAILITSIGVGIWKLLPQHGPENWQVEKQKQLLDKVSRYTIDAEFEPTAKTVKGFQKVHYINNEDTAINEVFFHLYPNAFKDENTLPFFEEEMIKAYPNGFSPGYINVSNVKSEGEFLKTKVDGTIMRVTLPKKLFPGEDTVIDMEFIVKLPPACGRFGYGENTFNLGNWYPVLAVYDDEGWNLDPYYSIGDPFYSDVALYDVSLKLPSFMKVAATGHVIKNKRQNGFNLISWKTGLVRDFAMIISPNFELAEKKVDGVLIKSYFLKETGDQGALDYAADSIKFFSKTFGKYPYKEFSVAAADFFIGGMEYPNIVFVDKTLYGNEFLEYVVVHETAHQWWYSMVGNDEVDEPWIDEGLTEYSTLMYYENKYGKDVEQSLFRDIIQNRYKLYELNNPSDTKINKPIYKFKKWLDYDALVYARAAWMFADMRKQLGDKAFNKLLKNYFREYIYKNVSSAQFIEFVEKNTNRNWDEFFKRWLDIENIKKQGGHKS